MYQILILAREYKLFSLYCFRTDELKSEKKEKNEVESNFSKF